MDSNINHDEASRVAKEAISYSLVLKRKYRANTTPLVHNFLVNVGIKDRGLCYEWSDDLYARLTRLQLKTIRLMPVGSHIGSYWSEHNALVILPNKPYSLKNAVLLDPWRDSGLLYFDFVVNDKSYSWKIRHDRGI